MEILLIIGNTAFIGGERNVNYTHAIFIPLVLSPYEHPNVNARRYVSQ